MQNHYTTRKRSHIPNNTPQHPKTMQGHTQNQRRNEDEYFCSWEQRLNLLVLGSRVMLNVYNINRQLDTVAFELLTVGDRAHRGGVLVQKVDLFE